MPNDDEITCKQAAELLGVTSGRVRQLCLARTLEARKIGRDWFINRLSVTEYSLRRKRIRVDDHDDLRAS